MLRLMAFDHGDAKSQCMLGEYLMRNENGTSGDAIWWLQASAAQGERDAYLWLGQAYLDGTGVAADVKKSRELFQAAAELGSVEAQFQLGETYNRDDLPGKHLGLAFEWYKTAADAGSIDGQCAVASFYQGGVVVEKSPEKTAERVQKAADQNSAHSVYLMATFYEAGFGVTKNPAKAEELMLDAANRGEIDALDQYGVWCATGRISPADPKAGRRWLELAANKGSFGAMKNMGILLFNGQLETSDPGEALVWLKRAQAVDETDDVIRGAILRLAEGREQYAVSHSYASGGERPDPALELMWLQRSAEAGYDTARYDLAMRLICGVGMPASPDRGIAWLRRAGDDGNLVSLVQLFVCATNGLGMAVSATAARESYARATKECRTAEDKVYMGKLLAESGFATRSCQLYRKAWREGCVEAAHLLGLAYLDGLGVECNCRRATRWLERAAAAGHTESRKRLDECVREWNSPLVLKNTEDDEKMRPEDA